MKPRIGLAKADYEAIAAFRHALRHFLRFSEEAARVAGLTPQQHQLLLAVKGFPGREWATIRELAERLELRHHTVVGEVDRAERAGLVARAPHAEDRRAVEVHLTARGNEVLEALTNTHRDELVRVHRELGVAVARLAATDEA